MNLWSYFSKKMKRRQPPIYSVLIDLDISDPKMKNVAVSSPPENSADDGITPHEQAGMANISDSHDFQAQTLGAPQTTEFRVSEGDENLPWLPSASGVIRLSKTSHNFGEVVVGDFEFWILTLINEGENEAIISDVSVLPLKEFSLMALPVLPFAIPPHGTRVITVRYAPDQVGNKSAAYLSLTTNDLDFPIQKVLLAGIGVIDRRNEPGGNSDKSMEK
jgi:hypothetical protein